MDEYQLEVCEDIARELIYNQGANPEYITISEALWDWGNGVEEEFGEGATEEMIEKIEDLISSAIITVEFPEDVA